MSNDAEKGVKQAYVVKTSDRPDNELVASMVEVENLDKEGNVLCEKALPSVKKKKKIVDENMFNHPKSAKEMEECGKKR